MIAAAKDESAKAVAKAIQAHKTVWEGETQEARDKLSSQASVWAAKHSGHRVACPSCSSTAIVTGAAVSPPTVVLKDELIVETQYHLPSKFQCISCGLTITGLSQLHAGGVGDTFKSTRLFEPTEYYAPHDEFDGYEDDNNER